MDDGLVLSYLQEVIAYNPHTVILNIHHTL